MQMNRLESALMNSPSKKWLQRHYEAPIFERLGGRVSGGRVLEIGCGNGLGAELALSRFGAEHVDAIDIDPRQVGLAQRRLSRRFAANRFRVAIGDAADLPMPDGSYDAVFDYCVLHHVTDWRRAVAEIGRVLRPGGRLYFEEVSATALRGATSSALLAHPDQDRFGPSGLRVELVGRGFVVGEIEQRVSNHLFFGLGLVEPDPPDDLVPIATPAAVGTDDGRSVSDGSRNRD